MKKNSIVLIAALLFAAATVNAGDKVLKLTSSSQEAVETLAEATNALENLRFGQIGQLSAKALELDPDFAFALMYQSVTLPQNQADSLLNLALSKNISEDEKTYIEAVQLNRQGNTAEAAEMMDGLAMKYPDDRRIIMFTAALNTGAGNFEKASKGFRKAIEMDDSTPRVHQSIANVYVMLEEYALARKGLKSAIKMLDRDTASPGLFLPISWTYLYEGKTDQALAVVDEMRRRYNRDGSAQGFPPVWIWNHTARINLENGRLQEALQDYETGYKSVPASQINDVQKRVWEQRALHGKARTLAKMGRIDEAWEMAETMKKLLDEEGTDQQKQQFEPAWHYLAGYIKLEAKEYEKAVDHLKQATNTDPFHTLLLGRAYEGAGDLVNAKAAYEKVAASTTNNIERALSYPEARKKLALLSTN